MAAPARTVWSAFNRWRKRHWPFRVIMLLILFAVWLVDAPILPRLVRNAIDSILAASEPAMMDAIYRSNKVNAARRLRNALVAKLDKDEDGVFNDSERERAVALGLAPDQLFAKPFRYDLSEIVAAAQRSDLVPPSYTARVIRKAAWRAAQAETEEIMTPEREEIDSMLVWYRVPNYLEWATWKRGAVRLYEGVRFYWLYLLGNPVHWIPFLVSVYLLGLIVSLSFPHKVVVCATGILSLAGLAIVVVVTARGPADNYGFVNRSWLWMAPAGYLLLILAVLLAGSRAVRRRKLGRRAARRLVILLGALLLCWGGITSFLPFRFVIESDSVTLYCQSTSYLMGIKIPLGVRIAVAVSGAITLVLAMAKKSRRGNATIAVIPVQHG
jgi:hypothetical protein